MNTQIKFMEIHGDNQKKKKKKKKGVKFKTM